MSEIAPAESGGASIHANALVVGEAGVIVRGASGSGKSSLTLALLALARERRIFARLIGDDRVLLRVAGGRLLASGAPLTRGLIERRGQGIVSSPIEACAIVRLVVDLLADGERAERLPEKDALFLCLEGVELPRLAFAAATAPLERALAVLEYLGEMAQKNMGGIAHFA